MDEMVTRPPRQRGRAASERALIDAAIACFAEVGPNDVSVRAIAERAGVNHGLVHHYFGSKSGLIHSSVEHMSKHISESMSAGAALVGGIVSDENSLGLLYARAFARIVIDDAMPTDVDWDFPLVRTVTDAAQRIGGLDEDNAGIAATQALAMVMGWIVLESWALRALGKQAQDGPALRAKLPAAAMRLANVQVPY